MDVLEIYSLIAQSFVDNIYENDWEKSYMLIERQEGMVSFGSGKYTDTSAFLKPFTMRDRQTSFKAARAINKLHVITTEGGNNRWNFLWFTLLPSGAYEIEFIWNQDEEDQLTFLEQTHEAARPERSAGLQRVQLTQAERRSPYLYDTLVKEVIKLIPEEWVSAVVTLREAGVGIVEHHAHYRSPAEENDDALNITYSWAVLLAVEQLGRLKSEGGHPDWQEATFTIEAAGSYRAAFTTQPASGSQPAQGYFYDGAWQTPPAAVSA